VSLLFKRLLLLSLFALLVGPAIQARFHIRKEKVLNGAFTLAPHPTLTWASLRANTFQPALEHYLEDRIGFRSWLIRFRNQLAFSLFRVSRSSDVVIGEHDVLFQHTYIEAYAGKNLLPAAEVRFRVARLRAMQHDLAQHGVQLLYAIAPNKARFEPENLPQAWRPLPGTITNYDLFAQQLRAQGINLLDFVPLFAQWKRTKPYPLYPRSGIHWSGYGATLAADTLMRRIAALTHTQVPAVRTVAPPTMVYRSDSLRSTDNDLGATMNLLFEREATPLAYPRLAFAQPQPGQQLPSVLFVSDSFVWGLMVFAPFMQHQLAPDTRVWFYNKSVHAPDTLYHATGEQAGDLDLAKQLASRQAVVLLFTEHNMVEQEYGFTERVYRLYHPTTAAETQEVNRLAAELRQRLPPAQASQNPEELAQHLHEQAQALYDHAHTP
jgi:hypothetical protein